MNWQDRIALDPKVLVGKPVIRGTRIAVEFLVDLLAEGWTHEQILKDYPQLTGDDIQAALHYAAEMLRGDLPDDLEGHVQAAVLDGRFASHAGAMAEAARLLLRELDREQTPATPPGTGSGSIGAMRDAADELDVIVADAYRQRPGGWG